MTGLDFLAAASVACLLAVVARAVVPPAPRLAARVSAYGAVSRGALRLSATDGRLGAGTFGVLVGTPLRAAASRLGRAVERRSDAAITSELSQAGLAHVGVDEFRVRQVVTGTVAAAVTALLVAAVTHMPLLVVAGIAAGFTWGAARPRARVERAARERAQRTRLELVTINQLLAIHVRTGAGPVQAVARLVARGHGVMVDDLSVALVAVRSGVAEAEAFRAAARRTPDSAAARTYELFAAASERGSDLAEALLGISADVRSARREQVRRDAVKRRAAMLVPTIAVLAPIMLLFVAAPIPSLVLGRR